MRDIKWALFCVLCATLASAQSPKEMAKTLESSLANQQLVLKNFSGDETVLAAWSGTGLTLEQPQWREFGVLNVDAVKLNGQKLTLRCTRRTVARDKIGRIVLYDSPTKVNIDVDLQGADPKEAVALIGKALFFSSLEDAIAAIPQPLQGTIPFPIDGTWPARKVAAAKPCDCNAGSTDVCDIGLDKNAEVQPPKLLHGADPQVDGIDAGEAPNGNVIIRLVVNKAGRPQDLWVLRPLGVGLDEAAAKSVLKYAFRPATCHGNPVSTRLNVEVNFQNH